MNAFQTYEQCPWQPVTPPMAIHIICMAMNRHFILFPSMTRMTMYVYFLISSLVAFLPGFSSSLNFLKTQPSSQHWPTLLHFFNLPLLPPRSYIALYFYQNSKTQGEILILLFFKGGGGESSSRNKTMAIFLKQEQLRNHTEEDTLTSIIDLCERWRQDGSAHHSEMELREWQV